VWRGLVLAKNDFRMAFPYAPVVVDPCEAEVVERHAPEFFQGLLDGAFMVVERFKNIDQCVLFHGVLLFQINLNRSVSEAEPRDINN
jgi:hypothetical protein